MDREYIYDVNGLNGVEKTVAKARQVLEILGHDSPNLKGIVDPDAKIVGMASFLGRNPGIDDLREYSDQLREAFYLYQGNAYLSTTLNISGRFCDESPVITAISVPKGTHILGPFGGEGEILLGRGYELEFVKSEIMDGKVFVYTKLHEREKIVTRSEDEIQITDEVDAVDAVLKDNEKDYSHHQGL